MPSNNPHLAEISAPYKFTSTNQPKNAGRKPSKLRKYLKANNLSTIDIQIVASNLITLSLEQLRDLASDTSKPIILTGAAKALLDDWKAGRTNTTQWLIDRAFGQAKQTMELSGALDVTQYTPEERAARIEEYERKRHEREKENIGPEI